MTELGDRHAGHSYSNIIGRDSTQIHAGDVNHFYGSSGLTPEQQCCQVFKTSTYEEYKDRNPPRADGTCQWVLTHPQFQRWRQSEQDDLLWISADPGCGKSVLAKSLVDRDLNDDGQSLVCYFFFKDNEEQDNLASALCAVLHQLFTQQPSLIQHALSVWADNGSKIRNEIQEMWRILQLLATDPVAPTILCVLDALDECRDHDRRQLIDLLGDFLSQDKSSNVRKPLKFLVTSRPYDSVQRWFEQTTLQWPHIRLRGEDENEQVNREINLVIDQHVKNLGAEFMLSGESQERLRHTLMQMQHRTYLWLHLAMDEVRESYQNSLDPETVVIESLPESVEEAYERLLQRISHKQQPNARQILLIIVGARRPLTIEEMAWALGSARAYKLQSTLVNSLNMQHLEKQIRHWCGLFVFIQHSTLFLIHQTAKEFLLFESAKNYANLSLWRGCLVPAEVELEMVKISTTYLCLFSDRDKRLEATQCAINGSMGETQHQGLYAEDSSFSFLRYCAEYWSVHFSNEMTIDRPLLSKLLALYDDKSDLLHLWFSHVWYSANPYAVMPKLPSQHVMAFNGHISIFACLYKDYPFDLEIQDSDGQTVLYWAACQGHCDMLKWLLEKGANADAQGGFNGNALQAALAHGGGEQTVQLLLDNGVDVNAQRGEEYGNALQAASVWGDERIVQLLLDNGADINAQGGYHGNALQAASAHGYTDVVQLLLDNGADINAQGRVYGNALQAASAHGYTDVVQLLLDNGADINVQEGVYGTAIHAAAAGGHVQIVQLLLDNGADINDINI